MSSLHELLFSQSTWWWPRMADHLWQTTLFALFVVAATFALRRGPARVRHALWMLAALKLLIPASLFVFFAEQAGVNPLWMLTGPAATRSDASLLQEISEPVLVISSSYQSMVTAGRALSHNELFCFLTGVWLIGSVTLFLIWGMRRKRFLQALDRGRRVEAGREWEIFIRAKVLLGLTTHVELVLSKDKIEPIVARAWRPVIMLPESIGEQLNDSELEAIMLHELVHVQRRDNLIGNLQMVLVSLLWFHPLVWFVSRKLITEREAACDERVLAVLGAPQTYASSILKVVRFSFGWKVAGVSGIGNGSNLRRRIRNIMSSNITKRSAIGSRLLAVMLIGLALVLMVLAGANTRARNEVESGLVANDTSAVSQPAVHFAGQRTRSRKPQPPTPPQPRPDQPAQVEQPAQPPQNPHPPQLAQPPQPAAPAQPAVASAQPAPPAPATPRVPSQVAPVAVPASATPPTPATAPAAPAQERKPKGQRNDSKGNLIEAPHPEYPVEARRDKISGNVTVEIEIDVDGKVASARAASGPDALRAAAVKAAYRARFKPAMVKGIPVRFSAALTYSFVIANCNGPRCSEL